MKENKYTQCILCEGDTFLEAVDKFNKVMRENAAFSPTFERAGEAFAMKGGYWKGIRMGLFCYGQDGMAQFDYYHVE